MKHKILNTVVVGSGLSGLSFINEFLKQKRHINLITPFKQIKYREKYNKNILENLPPQIINKSSINSVMNYFKLNSIKCHKSSEVLGSMEFGGLSNYWANQIELDQFDDLRTLGKKNINEINKIQIELTLNNNFISKLNKKGNIINHLKPPEPLNKIKSKKKNLKISKPNLALSPKKKNNINFNNDFEVYNAKNFYKKLKNKDKLRIYDYYLSKLYKEKNYYKLICKNLSKTKIIYAKRVILACGTIATTKILMDYLNIKNEIQIKHHQRMMSAFLAKNKYNSNMDFLNSVLWFKGKFKKTLFIGDLRIGSTSIINAIIRKYSLLKIFQIFLNYIRSRIFFSNIFLSTSFSNLYIKKKNKFFIIYSKKNKQKGIKNIFLYSINKISSILKENKLIFPFIIKRFLENYLIFFHISRRTY